MPQSVEPFEEIDDRPGFYGGVEWRYARRALLQLAHYDNRADPAAFRDGQWGWDTAFTHLAAQISLPAELGLIAQWIRGDTYWIVGARANGMLSPVAEIVTDVFESKFVMLTRRFATRTASPSATTTSDERAKGPTRPPTPVTRGRSRTGMNARRGYQAASSGLRSRRDGISGPSSTAPSQWPRRAPAATASGLKLGAPSRRTDTLAIAVHRICG